jgi:hypothetical protein
MRHALACFVAELGHTWFAWRLELHARVVEARMSGLELPTGPEPEAPSPAAAERVLRLLDG